MTERKNIKVQPEAFEQHNQKRQDKGLNWTEYLKRCEFVGDGRDTGGIPQSEDYWDTFDEKLQNHLGEWEITLNMDQLDLDPVGMNEDDVRQIVENWMENNWEQLKRGQISD